MAVRSSFKKSGLHEKLDFECLFSTTFEAVLCIFKNDYPENEIVGNGDVEKRQEESDPEDDATNPKSYYKAFKSDEQFFATQI